MKSSYLYKVDPDKISKYSNHIPGITSFDKKHGFLNMV